MSSLLENLLPGISNDVTLNHIVTKLRWPACNSLSAASLSWERAIEKREVYDARVYHHSTETLVVIKHQDSEDRGQGQWKDGEFPESISENLARGSGKMVSFRNQFPRILARDLVSRRANSNARGGNNDWFISAWHTYDKGAGCWRMVSPFQSLALDNSPSTYFFVKGKTYWIGPEGIFASEIHGSHPSQGERRWTFQHSQISWDEIGPMGSVTIIPLFVLPANDELLAIVQWKERGEEASLAYRYCLLQSRGFGTSIIDIVWGERTRQLSLR